MSTEDYKKAHEKYNAFVVERCETYKDTDILHCIGQDDFTANQTTVELMGDFLSDRVIV